MAAKNQRKLNLSTSAFRVKINGVDLREEQIVNITLSYSIHRMIPTGAIVFRDPSGVFFAKFQVSIGSPVNIIIISTQTGGGDNDVYEFHPWYVTSISDDSGISPENIAGHITLRISHAWGIYKDFTTHAYPQMVLSKLIKKIIEDESRGIKVDIGEIVDTQDLGNRPRYKYNLSDDAYIEKILLPYCMAESQSCFAYIDEMGQFFLDNFKTMFAREEDLCLYTSPTGQDMDSIKEIKKFKEIQLLGNPLVYIGDDEKVEFSNGLKIIKNLHPENIFDNENTGDILSVNSYYHYFTSEEKLLPFDKTFFKTLPTTDRRTFENRFPDDALALSRSLFNEHMLLFKAKGFINFSTQINIGSTAYFLPFYLERKDHWLSGRWILEDLTYYSEGATCLAKQSVTLARPDFTIQDGAVSAKDSKSTLAEIAAPMLARGKTKK
jgi:hypothetical protein